MAKIGRVEPFPFILNERQECGLGTQKRMVCFRPISDIASSHFTRIGLERQGEYERLHGSDPLAVALVEIAVGRLRRPLPSI